MDLYRHISQQIKIKLLKLSPAIEFVSIDEAYIDLSGTTQLHKKSPADILAEVAKDIETSFGLTIPLV